MSDPKAASWYQVTLAAIRDAVWITDPDDPFTQGDRSPDRSGGGLGIGLTLVRLPAAAPTRVASDAEEAARPCAGVGARYRRISSVR